MEFENFPTPHLIATGKVLGIENVPLDSCVLTFSLVAYFNKRIARNSFDIFIRYFLITTL